MTKQIIIPQGYKMTELGVIPKDWGINDLGYLCNYINDGTHYTPTYVTSGKPFYSVENVTGNDFVNVKYITKEAHEEMIRRCKPEKNDILLTRIGSLGQTKLIDWDIDASIYVSLALLKINDKIDVNYLYRFTKGNIFLDELLKRSLVNATPQKINMGDIKNIPIIIPNNTKEQKLIAQTLSDADELINSLDELIEKKEKIKEGAMQELLTGKRRLPGFNGEWEDKILGDIVNFKNGLAHEKSISDNGEYIVVNSKFISTNGEVKKFSNECYSPVYKDDVLMVMSDIPNGKAIAKCFIVDEDYKYTLNQRICALKINDNHFSKFIYFLINRNKYYLSFDDGVKQTNLRKEDVLGCELLLPSTFEEQKAIAEVLSDMDNEIKELKTKRDKYKEIKEGMMQELLTGRIRLV